jgi:hypothetical protein
MRFSRISRIDAISPEKALPEVSPALRDPRRTVAARDP